MKPHKANESCHQEIKDVLKKSIELIKAFNDLTAQSIDNLNVAQQNEIKFAA